MRTGREKVPKDLLTPLTVTEEPQKISKIQYEFTATQITRSNNHTLHTHARTLNTVTVDDDAHHDDKDLQKTQV